MPQFKQLSALFGVYLLALLGTPSAWAQPSSAQPQPYQLHLGADLGLYGAGLGLNTTYYILSRRVKPLTEAERSLLDRNNINAFDRSAAFNISTQAAKASDAVLIGGILTPGLLLASPRVRANYGQVAVLGGQTFALATGLTNITKVLVKRTRPYVYNPDAPAHWLEKGDSRYSYFSGHTSVPAAMCFFTAKVYHDHHDNLGGRIAVWSGAALVPAVSGFLRWRAGKHFWTDILSGYIIGAATGILVPELHRRRKP